jgi:hypothetical protein
MNPFGEHGKAYLAACFATAAAYAFTAGNQPAPYRAADACIYGCMLCFAGCVLPNIFRFAIPGRPKYGTALLSALAVLSVAVIVGTETLAMYLCAPALFGRFAETVPVRALITLLLFAAIRLHGLPHGGRGEARDAVPAGNDSLPAAPVDRIAVRSGQKIKIIAVDEILYIKADGDYISIRTADGCWLKEQTMNHTGDILPPDRFVRIHRSYIVNTCHISRIERCGGQQQIVLHNSEKIKISAARYHSLKQILGL